MVSYLFIMTFIKIQLLNETQLTGLSLLLDTVYKRIKLL